MRHAVYREIPHQYYQSVRFVVHDFFLGLMKDCNKYLRFFIYFIEANKNISLGYINPFLPLSTTFLNQNCAPGPLCLANLYLCVCTNCRIISFVKTSGPTTKAIGSDGLLQVIYYKVRRCVITKGFRLTINGLSSKYSACRS